MPKLRIELYFYQMQYPWEDEPQPLYVSSQAFPEDENRMLINTRTAMLDFPPIATPTAVTTHRVKHLQLKLQKVQADAHVAVTEIQEQIQKLLCIGSDE